jgi:hypothetical protein
VDAQISYLLAWPSPVTPGPESPLTMRDLRDAPYFTPVDIDVQPLGDEMLELREVPVAMRRFAYEGGVLVAECTYTLPDALSPAGLSAKLRLQAELRERLLADRPDVGDLAEEYTVLMIGQLDGTPDEFIERNRHALARFIRSQREAFTPQEVQETLISRVSYSEQELTVVDWEGAVVISTESDFRSDVELLKIGNYQLLRYRLLDRAIEQNLETVSGNLRSGARLSLLPNRPKAVLRSVVEQRLVLMLEFEKIKEGLLLIGDWYTAKLYRAIYDEFYLDDWEAVVKSKLQNLESIIQVIQENFMFSWRTFLGWVEIASKRVEGTEPAGHEVKRPAVWYHNLRRIG